SRGASFLNADDVALSNMTFTSVGTANGADPTVAAGTCGSLRVGTNTDCSAGVHADGVVGLALTNVDLATGAQQGVNGNNVTNFSMSNSNVSGFGDQTNESGLRFNNLLGTSSLSNVHVFNNSTTQVEIQNESGTLTSFNVSGSEFNHGGTTLGNGTDGMLFSAQGTAVMNIAITGSNFHDTFSGGFFSDSADTATMNISIGTSTFERFGSAGVTIAKVNSSNVTFNISNNLIHDTGRDASGVGHAININKATPSTAGTSLQGTVANNVLGDYADAVTADPDTDDRGTGVRIIGVSQGSVVVTVSNNDIRDFRERGILGQMSEDNSGNNSMALNITNNTVNNREAASTHAIEINSGTLVGDNGTLCANITGNNAFSTGGAGIRGRANQSTTYILPGFAGTPNDTTQLTAFVAANNPATLDTFSFARVGTLSTMTGGAACSTPVASNTLFAEPPVTGGDMQTADAGSVTAPSAATTTGLSFESAFVDMMRKVRSGFAYSDEAQPLGAVIGANEALSETPRATLSAAPVAAAMAGETVNVTIGTLRAGDSVTITFQVTVADPFPTNVQPPQVSNQGTVSGSNFTSVLTDDPSEPGGADPTVTPILTPPTISVNDATVAEPATGSTDMLFTVTLSHTYPQAVTVDYETATGGANPATAGTDYTPTSGPVTVTFAAGETVQTVSVPVLADGTAAEGDEHFLVNLSAPVNGVIDDGTATGTITDESTASQLIISELRTSGPGGSGDDFVELLNTTDANITVTSSDGSASGWSIVKSGTSCSTTPVVVGVIPEGTVIPARGNYLLTGSAYSLGAYGASNAALSADIEDDRNVGLFTTADLSNIGSANRLDAVGFGANTGNNCDLLREGTNLPAAAGSTSEYSFVRKVEKGLTLDTTDNAADFVVVSTTPSVAVGGNTPVQGAPGPEGLGSPRGPVPCSATTGSALFGRELIDPGVSVASDPNVVRDNTAVTNGANGTLDFRRTFTNNTGAAVTRLRFRIIDLSTFPAAAGSADLRALSSSAIVVSTTGGNKTVEGTTLETPPAQALGGGVNSTLAAGTITLATPLANAASVNLRFLFGV
ncbi:MAG TPA: Calx-beta domain-containing protein, partial [Pyrinomonadaceae bacterium]